MKRVIIGSDADRVNYGSEQYEWLATKDVEDSDGFITNYSMYRRRSDGMYVCVFGDRDLYRPEDEDFDFETENESEAWEWFDSYEGFADEDDGYDGEYDSLLMSTAITANRDDRYFGEIASKKYGDLIADTLGAGYTISKRKTLGEKPHGLIYEAERLGIDMWDLLEALEGMCADGRAEEIDDSTYQLTGELAQEVEDYWF